jgi:hypothetical protein
LPSKPSTSTRRWSHSPTSSVRRLRRQ